MRGATAKAIRRSAKAKAIAWYETLLPTDEPVPAGDELYSYVVGVDYSTKEGSRTVVVSQNTKRRFLLEEKKLWKA